MPLENRRERELSERRQLIVATARAVAEAEGWDAVTTRRLSTEIEYSQPVLYKHFAGMDQIVAAVAIDGFAELAEVIRAAGSGDDHEDTLVRIAHAYVRFSRERPAVYDAMFTRATPLRFASDDTPPELEAAFTALRRAVGFVAGNRDADTLTEVFWAGLHGLVTLSRSGRLRPGVDSERLKLLVGQIVERQPRP